MDLTKSLVNKDISARNWRKIVIIDSMFDKSEVKSSGMNSHQCLNEHIFLSFSNEGYQTKYMKPEHLCWGHTKILLMLHHCGNYRSSKQLYVYNVKHKLFSQSLFGLLMSKSCFNCPVPKYMYAIWQRICNPLQCFNNLCVNILHIILKAISEKTLSVAFIYLVGLYLIYYIV